MTESPDKPVRKIGNFPNFPSDMQNLLPLLGNPFNNFLNLNLSAMKINVASRQLSGDAAKLAELLCPLHMTNVCAKPAKNKNFASDQDAASL